MTGGALGHRCGHCDHWDRQHYLRAGYLVRGGWGCRHWVCNCDEPGNWGPTEVYPLYVGHGPSAGEPIGYVIPPGQAEHGARSCSCQACHEFHAAWSAQHARSTA